MFQINTHNCGSSNRVICINLDTPKKIIIGCFEGTKKEAIKRIKNDYKGKEAKDYIKKVKKCFKLAKKKLSK